VAGCRHDRIFLNERGRHSLIIMRDRPNLAANHSSIAASAGSGSEVKMLAPNSTGSVIPLSSTDNDNTDKLDAAGHSILQLIGKAAGIAEEHTQHVLKSG
jgi:hypothetical protein